MPERSEVQSKGYLPVFRSDKFEIWHQPNEKRVYVILLYPLSNEEAEMAVRETERLGIDQMDLITDHLHMPSTDQVEDQEISVCLDDFFQRFKVRNIVRVCDARENCSICVPLDATLSTEEKGRILGRVYSFTDATRLLDHQQGVP